MNKLTCKLGIIPIDPNHKLELPNNDISLDKEMYHKLIERLIYLLHTRSDVTYTISVICRFIHGHKEVHLQAIYKVLYYLKGHMGNGSYLERMTGCFYKFIHI